MVRLSGKYRKIVAFVVLISVMVSLWGWTVRAETSGGVLRVGFFAFDGYHNQDEAGHRSGYGYEFIQKMLRYNNYTAQYIGYDKSWSEMQDMLANGEIDLLTSAQKTQERERVFDFSKPIGTSAAILTVKAGNETIRAGEYDTYHGIRVGVIEGNSRNDRFEEFAQEKGFTYTLVYYNDIQAMQEDLQNSNRIDAIVTSNLRRINGEWVLDKFAVSPFYAMVKKGNTELLSVINAAIDQMNSNSVGWQDELFDQYYSGGVGDAIALSSTERAFLAQLHTDAYKVKVLVHPDRAPYSYLEGDTPKGIIVDIFEETARRLDLPYMYVVCKTREEYAERKSSGQVDVVLESRNDLCTAENMGYKLTDPYMTLSYCVLERSDYSGEIKTVAVIDPTYTTDENTQHLIEEKEAVYCKNLQECAEAVENRKADAAYLYEYSGQKFASENITGKLQATTIPEIGDSLTFAVSARADYRLLTVLNKGILSVKENYADIAIRQNTDFSIGELTPVQVVMRNPMILVLMIFLFFLMIGAFVLGVNRKRNAQRIEKKNRELERFIGYVCKVNASVKEVNFKTGKQIEYQLQNGKIALVESDFPYRDDRTVHADIPDEDFQALSAVINKENVKHVIDSMQDVYFECRLKEEKGYRWYSITMTPIPRDEEHPSNMLIFKQDIHDAKQHEEDTKKSLRDALDAANQASVSKGSFLSNMSHEIRTPLNAIIGYLTLAKDPDTTPEKAAYCIDNCEIASKHLLQIINDILDMSSIESGKLKIASEEFDLKKEITDITTIFYQNAQLKNIHFETRIDGLTEEWVIGDPLRLNQVLMNLLSNALKFTPDNGTVSLDVHQIQNDEKKVYLRFVVKDTGIGMSKEYMSRIFTPFEQENAGTAKRFGGSGLGLSITHNLVKMMGGNIAVSSVQGEGTEFTVTIYFTKSLQEHRRELQQTDYSHVRVLIVDDKEDECTYMKTMLSRCGVKSDCVTSGKKALRRIKDRLSKDSAYDLCIIDWNMPEMDGCQVTKQIRTEMGTEMPIIIATAYDVSSFQDEAKELGVDRIVAKPLFQSTIFDLLVSTFGSYQPMPEQEETQEKMKLTGLRLLLAEDNPMNMDIAVTILEKTGITVDQVSNGKEAVDLFLSKEQGTYHLILMDVQMPVMDGYEAARMIRHSSHPQAKTIPIIAMTANAFAEDVAEALANGMNAHISKPINYRKLFAVLKNIQKASAHQDAT